MSAAWQEILISAVRQRPVLWDKTNSNYCNKTIKENNWSDVAKEIFESAGKSIDGQSVKFSEVI
jgi:hypothetical protein